jgi:enoyl-CoA hydratase/carnithine racemase
MLRLPQWQARRARATRFLFRLPGRTSMSLILVTDDGPVRTVRMNRPEKKNALTPPMYEALSAALSEKREGLRCIVVAGNESGFTAGNDIGAFMAAAQQGGELGGPTLDFLHALARCETPLGAAVGGVAVGVGTTMLLHCDYVVAASDARLSTPFVALGLLPEAASTLLAPRLMGHARAFELMVMGHPFSADEAKAAGLVNKVVAPAELEAAALAAAREIAALPPEGVKIARRLMRGAPDEAVARIDEEAKLFRERLASPEAQAAFMAFLTRKR